MSNGEKKSMQTLREDENYWMWINSVFITHSHRLFWTATHCSVSGKWLSLNPSLHTWLNLMRERERESSRRDDRIHSFRSHTVYTWWWYLCVSQQTLAYKKKRFSYIYKCKLKIFVVQQEIKSSTLQIMLSNVLDLISGWLQNILWRSIYTYKKLHLNN